MPKPTYLIPPALLALSVGLPLAALDCPICPDLGSPCTVDNDPSHPADHRSIQAAVDDLSCLTITVGPGSYHEQVRISRPLTLVGTQFLETHIQPDQAPALQVLDTHDVCIHDIFIDTDSLDHGPEPVVQLDCSQRISLVMVWTWNRLDAHAAHDGGIRLTDTSLSVLCEVFTGDMTTGLDFVASSDNTVMCGDSHANDLGAHIDDASRSNRFVMNQFRNYPPAVQVLDETIDPTHPYGDNIWDDGCRTGNWWINYDDPDSQCFGDDALPSNGLDFHPLVDLIIQYTNPSYCERSTSCPPEDPPQTLPPLCSIAPVDMTECPSDFCSLQCGANYPYCAVLDASGSKDPDDPTRPLACHWSSTDPDVYLPITDDNCASTTVCVRRQNADDPKVNWVNLDATDACGSTCSETVNVPVKECPVTIVCPADLTVDAGPEPGCIARLAEGGLGQPGFTDSCDPNPDIDHRPPGYEFHGLGPHDVEWILVDRFNNTASCNQVVTVTDHGPPTIEEFDLEAPPSDWNPPNAFLPEGVKRDCLAFSPFGPEPHVPDYDLPLRQVHLTASDNCGPVLCQAEIVQDTTVSSWDCLCDDQIPPPLGGTDDNVDVGSDTFPPPNPRQGPNDTTCHEAVSDGDVLVVWSACPPHVAWLDPSGCVVGSDVLVYSCFSQGGGFIPFFMPVVAGPALQMTGRCRDASGNVSTHDPIAVTQWCPPIPPAGGCCD